MRGALRSWTRRAPLGARTALDPWCLIGAYLCGVFPAAGLSAHYARLIRPVHGDATAWFESVLPPWVPWVPWLVLLGCAVPLLFDRIPMAQQWRRRLETAWVVIFVLTVLAVPGSAGSLFLVLPLAALGMLARHARGDAVAAAAAWTGLFLAAMVGSMLPLAAGVLVATATLGACLTTLLWVHARSSYRLLLSKRGLRQTERPSPPENGDGARGRLVLALVLTAMMWLVMVGGYGVGQLTQRWQQEPEEEEAAEAVDPDASGADSGENVPAEWGGAGSADGVDVPGAPAHRVFPEKLGFGGSLGLATHGRMLEVRVLEPAEDQRAYSRAQPLYLKSRHYTEFRGDGLGITEMGLIYDDAGDGAKDGWVEIRPIAAREPTRMLQIRQRPLRPSPREEDLIYSLLHRVEPLYGVWAPEVRYHVDGPLEVIHETDDLVVYVLEVGRFRPDPMLLGEDALAPAGGDTYLPQAGPWLQVRQAVQEELRRMDLSRGEVRGVLQHFRSNYTYSLDTSAAGPAAMGDFFTERRGYCVFYATAAMMCLRELGVPARVVGGYRVTDWDAEAKAYAVGGGGAHAWVEVLYRDHGWLAIDPTPGSQVDTVVAAASADYQERLRNYLEAQDALEEGDEVVTGENTDEGPAALAEAAQNRRQRWLRIGIFAFSLSLLLTTIALLTGLLEKRRREAPDVDDPIVAQGLKSYRRLCRELAKHGFPKSRTQTPREHADRVLLLAGPDLAPLNDVVRYLYALRFGPTTADGADRLTESVHSCQRAIQGVQS